MNAIVKSGHKVPANPLTPQNLDQAMRLAEMMARSKTLPAHLHNSPGDCLMVIERATRWGMSPFAVAQCTSIISGKLMFEGKLVAAAIESSGLIVGGFDYQFSGSGDDLKVIVSATRRGENEPRTVDATVRNAKTTNSMWVKQPEQQLVYFGTRKWGRRWAPSVELGVNSREEFDSPPESFGGTTIDVTVDTPVTPVYEPEPPKVAPPKKTNKQWLDELEIELETADKEGVENIMARDIVQKQYSNLKDDLLERLKDMVGRAIKRTNDPHEDADMEMMT